jgi:arylsulfatase A-like enzyme
VTRSLLEVPCLLRLPEDARPEAPRLQEATSNVDILPTLVELAGLKTPEITHGLSLLAAETPPAYVFSFGRKPEEMNMSRVDARYRYTLFPQTGKEELFDHQEDPGECVNRSGDLPEQVEAFRQELALYHLQVNHPCSGRVASW